MPAAAWVAPAVGSGSATATPAPRWAARNAMARPTTPPPMTSTSGAGSGPATALWLLMSRSLRRHDPDQVPAVGGSQPPSQSGRAGLPRDYLQPTRAAPGGTAAMMPAPFPP